jgi:hypothetical protein
MTITKLQQALVRGITGFDLLATSALLLLLMPRLLIKSWISHEVVWLTSGGFGHTIHGPDVARRFLRGRILVVVSAWPRRVNKDIASVWANLEIIYIPLFLIRFSENHILIRDRFINIIQLFLTSRVFICTDRYQAAEKIRELYQLPLGYAEAFGLKVRSLKWNEPTHEMSYNWLLGYFKHIQLDKNESRLSYHEKLAHEKFRDLHFRKETKLVMLYLRGKKGEAADSFWRDSSPVTNYLPLFEYFRSQNIHCLVTGDWTLSPSIRSEYPLLWDCDNLGITKQKFYIFSAIACDYFIGAAGGGVWLPSVIYRKPTLLIECAPLGFAVPNSLILNKQLVVKINNHPVYEKDSLEEMAFRFDSSQFDLVNNTAEQIYQASKLFIEHVEYGRDVSLFVRPSIGALEMVSKSKAFDLNLISRNSSSTI